MSNSTLPALKLYIEQIARPVRAFQSRKLRMRLELLAHLHAAVAEEQNQCTDEALAIERAKLRLGEPLQLTRELQQSVPRIERLLLTRVRTPKLWDRWENWAGQGLGFNHRMTMGHAFMLMWAVYALFLPAYVMSIRSLIVNISALASDAPIRSRALVVMITAATNILFIIYLGYTGSVSANRISRTQRRRAIGFAAGAICLQLICSLLVATTFGGGHPLGRLVFAGGLGTSAALLLALSFVARAIASLRRPYDEWLSLDVEDTDHAEKSLRFE